MAFALTSLFVSLMVFTTNTLEQLGRVSATHRNDCAAVSERVSYFTTPDQIIHLYTQMIAASCRTGALTPEQAQRVLQELETNEEHRLPDALKEKKNLLDKEIQESLDVKDKKKVAELSKEYKEEITPEVAKTLYTPASIIQRDKIYEKLFKDFSSLINSTAPSVQKEEKKYKKKVILSWITKDSETVRKDTTFPDRTTILKSLEQSEKNFSRL